MCQVADIASVENCHKVSQKPIHPKVNTVENLKLRNVLLVLVALTLTACQGSLLKKAATDFDKASQVASSGTLSLLNDYDAAQKWKASFENEEIDLNPPRIEALVAYPTYSDTAVRLASIKSLALYAEALGKLASIGSAKSNGDALKGLGASIKQSGSSKADDWGKLVGQLASLITDAKVGAQINQIALTANPTVQELISKLSGDLALIRPTVNNILNDQYTRLRNAHSELGCSVSCTKVQKLNSTRLVLEMSALLEKRSHLTMRTEKAVAALTAMATAHTALTQKASGQNKTLLRDSIVAYIKAANDLQDLLIKLEV